MNEAAKTFLECGDLSPLSKAPTSRRTPKLILPQTPNMRHAGGVRTDAKRRALSLAGSSSLAARHQAASPDHGPNRCRYSIDVMNALTISASMKFPLN